MCLNHYIVTVAATDKLTSFFLFLVCGMYFHALFPFYFLCFLNNSYPLRFIFISFLANTVLNQKNIISKKWKGLFVDNFLQRFESIVYSCLSKPTMEGTQWWMNKVKVRLATRKQRFEWTCEPVSSREASILTPLLSLSLLLHALLLASGSAPVCDISGTHTLFLAVVCCYYCRSHDL